GVDVVDHVANADKILKHLSRPPRQHGAIEIESYKLVCHNWDVVIAPAAGSSALLRVLAHDLSWAIVRLLATGDLRVREVVAATGPGPKPCRLPLGPAAGRGPRLGAAERGRRPRQLLRPRPRRGRCRHTAGRWGHPSRTRAWWRGWPRRTAARRAEPGALHLHGQQLTVADGRGLAPAPRRVARRCRQRRALPHPAAPAPRRGHGRIRRGHL